MRPLLGETREAPRGTDNDEIATAVKAGRERAREREGGAKERGREGERRHK
jgi:hypothetical protein